MKTTVLRIFVSVCLALVAVRSAVAEVTADAKPNIVMILVDDNSQ